MIDMRSAVPVVALAIVVFVVLAILKFVAEGPAADGGTPQRFPASQIEAHTSAVSEHVPAGQLIRPGESE